MDPGGHTGLAWGIFDETASIPDAIAKGVDKGSLTITGDEYDQIGQIAAEWRRFYKRCVEYRLLDPTRVEFVSEDFIERTDLRGKEHQSPIRILWGVEGYRMGRADEFAGRRHSPRKVYCPRVILQHPSLGSAINPKRLRAYGCWVVGKDHERSAWRHIIVRLGVVQRAAPGSAKVPARSSL
jgi:hypothetical protein